MLSHQPVTSNSKSELPANSLHTDAALADVSSTDGKENFEEKLEEAVEYACAPLIGIVPRAHRLAKQRALREELNTLVAAHSELETNPEQAVDAAIAHFHRRHPADLSASSLQASHLQASVQTEGVTQTHSLQTATTANQESRPAMLLSLGLLSSFYLTHLYNGAERVRALLGMSETALYRWELIGVPLFIGLVVGLLMRRRAARGALLACGGLAAYAVLYPSLLVALVYMKLLPFEDSDIYKHLVPDPIAGFCGLALWPLFTCAGASLGAKLRKIKG